MATGWHIRSALNSPHGCILVSLTFMMTRTGINLNDKHFENPAAKIAQNVFAYRE